MSRRWDANFRWRNNSVLRRRNFFIIWSIITFRTGQTTADAIVRPNTSEESRTTKATTTTASILIQFTRTEAIGISEILRKDSRQIRFITPSLPPSPPPPSVFQLVANSKFSTTRSEREAHTKLDKIVNTRSRSNTYIKCIRVFHPLLHPCASLVIFRRLILQPQLMNRGLTLLAHDNLHTKQRPHQIGLWKANFLFYNNCCSFSNINASN